MSPVKPTVYQQCGLRLRSELELALPCSRGDGWDVDVRWGPDIHDLASQPSGEVIAVYAGRRHAVVRGHGHGIRLLHPLPRLRRVRDLQRICRTSKCAGTRRGLSSCCQSCSPER